MDQQTTTSFSSTIQTPFSYDETIHLILTVEEEPQIVARQTDEATMLAKIHAWERVWRKFNLGGKFSRDIFALKDKWDSLEREAGARRAELGTNSRTIRHGAVSVQDLLLDKVAQITTNTYSEFLNEMDEAVYENCENLMHLDLDQSKDNSLVDVRASQSGENPIYDERVSQSSENSLQRTHIQEFYEEPMNGEQASSSYGNPMLGEDNYGYRYSFDEMQDPLRTLQSGRDLHHASLIIVTNDSDSDETESSDEFPPINYGVEGA